MTTLNNRTLTIVLIALVAVYVGARIFRAPNRESTLNIVLVDIDTSAVKEILLYPTKGKGEEIRLTRGAGGWNVRQGEIAAEADSNVLKSLMGSFIGLKASRVVTEQASKWSEYNVGDTTGTRIVVKGEGDHSLGEWWVGEAPAKDGAYGGGQSYVRLANKDNVYAVDGYLHTQYNKPFNDWRNKAFLRVDKSNLSGVTAQGAITWELKKDSVGWLLDRTKTDSLAVERYVSRFTSMNFSDFSDGFQPTKGADASLTLHSPIGDLANIQAWKTSDSTWVVQSSQRPKVFFEVDHTKFTSELIPLVSVLREAGK